MNYHRLAHILLKFVLVFQVIHFAMASDPQNEKALVLSRDAKLVLNFQKKFCEI